MLPHCHYIPGTADSDAVDVVVAVVVAVVVVLIAATFPLLVNMLLQHPPWLGLPLHFAGQPKFILQFGYQVVSTSCSISGGGVCTSAAR